MDIQVEVQNKTQKPVQEVFNGIVDPKKLSKYFISSSTGFLKEGTTVTWTWEDVDAEAEVFVKKVIKNQLISFEWSASGTTTQVDIALESTHADVTVVHVIETGWKMNQEGVSRSLGQCQGWTHMLCCMKAFLEHKINLRK